MCLFELSKKFPREEMYSLTDQKPCPVLVTFRFSAHISKAGGGVRYEAAFAIN